MSPIEIAVPSKVILAGEYSVLDGFPALINAVDRCFQIRYTPGSGLCTNGRPGAANTMSLNTPGLSELEFELELNARAHIVVPEGRSELAMFEFLFNELSSQHALSQSHMAHSSCQMTMDASALFDQGEKLGLGSSAAMTVALDRLFAVFNRQSNTNLALLNEGVDQQWRRLHLLHSEAQGKEGSGADIASSLVGGTIIFRNLLRETTQDHCHIKQIELPETLHTVYLWSGTSASTPIHLNSLSRWKAQFPDVYWERVAALGEASVQVCQRGEASADVMMDALKRFVACLVKLDADAQIGIFGGGHQEAYERSLKTPQIVYKPCGAGGGDLGVAMSKNVRELKRFVKDAERLGFRQVRLNVAGAPERHQK